MPTPAHNPRPWLRVVVAGVLIGLAMPLAACRGDRSDNPPREFLPDMDHQPRWNPQSETTLFVDGRTMRKPAAGTVAFARVSFDPSVYGDHAWASEFLAEREELLAEDRGRYFGVAEGVDPETAYQRSDAEAFVARVPIEVDSDLLARGRERFDIYCSACHGYEGDGGGMIDGEPYGGMVGRRWSYAVPSFHDAKYKDRSQRTGRDGYIYYVAMRGVQDPPPDGSPPGTQPGRRMPAYSHALSSRDAWAIVAYIRALQRSKDAELADVPPEQRELIERPGGGGTARVEGGDDIASLGGERTGCRP